MYKKQLIFLFLLGSALFLFAQEDEKIENNIDIQSETDKSSLNEDSIISNSDGYISFLSNCINRNISVVLKNVDNAILGNLEMIYSDGIVLQTAFNSTIFIPKTSISYIKISKMNQK